MLGASCDLLGASYLGQSAENNSFYRTYDGRKCNTSTKAAVTRNLGAALATINNFTQNIPDNFSFTAKVIHTQTLLLTSSQYLSALLNIL